MRTLVALALVLLAAAPLAGEAPDPAVQEALAATLRVVRDPALRSPAVARSPRAAAIDTEGRAMTGAPQLTQEFYDLRSEEHTSELQSQSNIVCRLLPSKKK